MMCLLYIQVTFFQQGTIPCVSKDGRFIMETPFKVKLNSSVLFVSYFKIILQNLK